ncbi:C-reactive protein-like [Salmo trutta]|uniref:C-reactive protein-like n=1 Tax=Salmo trutta TaxID=8032 RepID=UPI0011326E0E|nr:C-reactive protein-like [Salmo trutta]XP_029594883.1 C-reactive protein-like [Salmo trutta]
MSGKEIIFPVESNTAYVKITPDMNKIFFAVTVCVRFFTDYQTKDLTIFKLATPSHANGFVIFRGDGGNYWVYIGDQGIYFWGLPDKMNEWNSVCGTWDASTGLTQLWVNGKPSARKALQAGGSISGTLSIILGQDQDAYAGGFDVNDSFYGHETDVHMWDRVLSPCEIQSYMKGEVLSPGNVVNWNALKDTRHGYVVVERMQNLIC